MSICSRPAGQPRGPGRRARFSGRWIHACPADCRAGMRAGLDRRASPQGEMVVRTENLNDGRHVVQFYGRDRELAEWVAGFLREGLERGGPAAVVATPEHRREFEARLAEAGLDLQVDAFAEVCRLH